MNKIIFSTAITAYICCCFLSCEPHNIHHEIENPFIRFVNQSDDTVWVEMLTHRELDYFSPQVQDSIFYGIDQMIPPQSIRQSYASSNPHWTGYTQPKEESAFAARVFVMDSCAPVNIINYKNSNKESVIQTLKSFEKNHLIFKHLYTKREIDSLNWTIVFPQK